MEECEALCTRLVIMVNGQFKCLGSPQYLKTKFGNGYKLTARLSEESSGDELLAFMDRTFPGSQLESMHKSLFEFTLPNDTKLSTVFGQIERNRATLNLIDYSLSQSTLDQIFVNFAKKQSDENLIRAGESSKKSSRDQFIDGFKSKVSFTKSALKSQVYFVHNTGESNKTNAELTSVRSNRSQ